MPLDATVEIYFLTAESSLRPHILWVCVIWLLLYQLETGRTP